MSTIRLIPKPNPIVITAQLGASSVITPAFLNNTGNTINEGAFVYVDDSEELQLAVATSELTGAGVGFVAADVPHGASASLKVSGLSQYQLEDGAPGASPGDLLFLSATDPGKLSTSPPEVAAGRVVVQVGSHMSDQVLINIRIMTAYT